MIVLKCRHHKSCVLYRGIRNCQQREKSGELGWGDKCVEEDFSLLTSSVWGWGPRCCTIRLGPTCFPKGKHVFLLKKEKDEVHPLLDQWNQRKRSGTLWNHLISQRGRDQTPLSLSKLNATWTSPRSCVTRETFPQFPELILADLSFWYLPCE